MAVAMIGPKFYAWDRNGKPLAFGKLYTYQARTNTPKPTYQSEDQVVENTNPVILNGEGYANVYLDGSYKMVLKDDKDNDIWSSDPVSSAQASEWVNCLSAVYLNPSSFKVAGNFINSYEPGRRVRINNNSSEYYYSTIELSVFSGGETTIVISDPFVTTGISEVCISIVGPESTGVNSILNFSTLEDAVNSKIVKVGYACSIKERTEGDGGGGLWDFVELSSVNVNGFDVVGSVGVPDLALVLRIEGDVFPKQLGAICDNSNDDYGPINQSFIIANDRGKNVDFEGCVFPKISGDKRITVKCSVFLSSCTLNVEDWDGGFDILRNEEKVTYGSSSGVVQSLISAGTMDGNYWPGWLNIEEVSDSFVMINTSQPFYGYNGVLVPRMEMNKVLRNGVVESPLKYPLDPNLITSIDVFPMEKKRTTFGGGSIFIGSRDFDSKLFNRQTSLHKYHDIRLILDDVVLSQSNPVLFFDEYFCQVELEDVYLQWGMETTATTGFTYHLQSQNGYDYKCTKVQGMGDGWGVTGNSIVQRVEFNKCDLSRIDYHHPFREYLKVNGGRLGDFGLLITGIGDVELNKVEHILRDGTPSGKSSGFVRLRIEANGFCDGDLIIDGCKYNFNSESEQYLIRSFGNANVPDLTGSPIKFTCFNQINGRNMRNTYKGVLKLAPVLDSALYGVLYPTSITYVDCEIGLFDFQTNLSNYTPGSTLNDDSILSEIAEPNLTISLDNVKLPNSSKISITDNKANNFGIQLILNRMTGRLNDSHISLELSFAGKVSANSSNIESVDFESGGVINKFIRVSIGNSNIKFTKRFVNFLINGFVKGKSQIFISNTSVAFDEFADVNSNVLSQASLSKNSYIGILENEIKPRLKLQDPSVGSIGLINGIFESNTFTVEYSDGVLQEFSLPDVGMTVELYKSSSEVCTITRGSATSIKIAGSANPVQVYIS